MSNYCENYLSVDGPEKRVNEFFEQLKGSEGEVTFKKLLPAPQGTGDLYEWQAENYGTKCDGGTFSEFVEDGVFFSTAWSPPIAFLENVSKQFRELSFGINYYEIGFDICGSAEIENGTIVEHREDSCQSELALEIYGEYPG